MSGIGHARHQAEVAAKREAKKSGTPYISGFCNPTNPRTAKYDPHARCTVTGCTCSCHTISDAEPVNDGQDLLPGGADVAPDESKGTATPSATPAASASELDLTPGSPEWCRRVSPSKAAAILGISPWDSQYAIWRKMRGDSPWDEETEAMERGNLCEPAVLAWWRKHYTHTEWAEQVTYTVGDWLVATPDGKCLDENGDRVLVEAKTASDDDDWGTPGTDVIPPYYLVQVFLAGRTATLNGWQPKRIHVPLLGPRLRFSNYVVEYDDTLGAEIESLMWEFYQSLSADVAPPLDDSLATFDAVRKIHPDVEPKATVEVPPAVAVELVRATTSLDQAEADARLAKATVLELMGRANYADCNGVRVARRQPNKYGISFVPVAKSTDAFLTDTEQSA